MVKLNYENEIGNKWILEMWIARVLSIAGIYC